jgi:hypothetical protein
VLVPLTATAAGLLFATSAATAQGTDLRADRRLQLTELIARERPSCGPPSGGRGPPRRGRVAGRKRPREDGRVAAVTAGPELELAAGLVRSRDRR